MSAGRITSLDIRCPTCGANAGARCKVLSNPVRNCPPHESRTAEAKRLNRVLHPEHVDGQLPLIPRSQL